MDAGTGSYAFNLHCTAFVSSQMEPLLRVVENRAVTRKRLTMASGPSWTLSRVAAMAGYTKRVPSQLGVRVVATRNALQIDSVEIIQYLQTRGEDDEYRD